MASAAPAAAPAEAEGAVCVCVLGGPATGKSTHCKQLAESAGYAHISIGQLLQAGIEDGSISGDAAHCVSQGAFVGAGWHACLP